MTNTSTPLSNYPSQLACSPSVNESAKVATGCKFISLAVIFCLALSLRLWFNLLFPHINAYSAADAAEYLRNAQALSLLKNLPATFWQTCLACLSGTASLSDIQAVKTAFQPLHDFYISGPTFPLFLMASYAIFGLPVDITNWIAPVVVQSVFSSLACVFIAMTGAHAWNRTTGIIAGLLAAIYPAFIVNSGRLYSESFACFLVCLMLWLTVRGFSARGNNNWILALSGLVASALQLTRSVMFVATLALFPITFIQRRSHKPLSALLSLTVGLSAVLIPWLCWQKLAFGTSNLVVDRVGHYNFFIGNNVDTQGWLSFPYPDGRGIESKSLPQLLKEGYSTSPSRWFKLMLDKPLRLFKFPWNDFRTPIGPVTIGWQVLLHQFILLMAAAGAVLALALNSGDAPPTREQLFARFCILGFFLGHLVYCSFITVPRYNLTAIPCLILLGAAGITAIAMLFNNFPRRSAPYLVLLAGAAFFVVERSNLVLLLNRLFNSADIYHCLSIACLAKAIFWIALISSFWNAAKLLPGNQRLFKTIAVVLAASILPLLCLPVRANGRWYEWQYSLDHPGQSITQTIVLPSTELAALRNRPSFLMIDSAGARPLEQGLTITLNGIRLSAPIIPSLSLAGDLSSFKQTPDHGLYLEDEYIFDCLTAPAGSANRDLRQWFLLPITADVMDKIAATGTLTIEITKTDHVACELFGACKTDQSHIDLPSINLYSWEKAFYGVENDRGLTDPRYDMKVSIASTTRTEPAPASGSLNIRLLLAPASAHPPELISLAHKQFGLTQLTVKDTYTSSIATNELPKFANTNTWLIRISGQSRVSNSQIQPHLDLSLTSRDASGQTYSYAPAWMPRSIASSPEWNTFDITFPVAPAGLPGHLSNIQAKFHLAPPLVTCLNQPDIQGEAGFKNVQMEIMLLPASPLSPGYKIY